ncbi:MAG: hypothetical protein ABS63_06450 [Microbacterium sp. SCN 70-27]|uniref:transglutaminase-like domain-containing protein n=1 Tax=unclassified Microbacterium TaxID=2609290 RepID=UPI00086EECEA|nr:MULTISPECIES: transglutaminase-like domain-containing protein [unclassified Microbacterium]MBN9224035.1 transglutaminase domain-containing protein [Microbacterium sp.]ODT27932.1 MAG: hypothetical protein ABS63_06450 [Microbacterium sp. SCN 70-27]
MSAPEAYVDRARIVDLVVVTTLCVLALVPLSSAYEGIDFWIAAVGGVLLGAAVAFLGARWSLNPLVVAAIAALGYFLFGTALAARPLGIAGVVPSGDSLISLATGVVQVWKRALTLTVPLDVFPGLAVAPFLLGLVGAVCAASFALRLRRAAAVALVPVAALLAASIAFGTYEGTLPAVVGSAMFATSLGWIAWRRRRDRRNSLTLVEDAPESARRRLLPVLGGLAVLIVTAAGVGGAVAVAAAPDTRQVLRDHVVPPLDMHDYSSPLTLFRRYTTDGADSKLFTVEGLPDGVPVRLATLDLYDGTAFVVSGGGGAGSGSFTRVGRSIPLHAAEQADATEAATVTVRVESLAGVWMPTVGYLSSLRFTGDDAGARNAGLHYNPTTGTAVDVDGLRSGDSYVFDARVSAAPTDEELADATVSGMTTPQPVRVPEAVGSAISEAAGDATSPAEQVRAVQTYLSKRGFFSNGLAGQTVSRAGHGLARENDLLSAKQMIGDDEQYSVAMSLMLAQLGIPSRVVMGFTAPSSGGGAGTATITAGDVHAWVEVPFDGYGWVAFDPTPAKDRVPEQITEQQKQKPLGQVVQPPDVPQEPAQLPPAPPAQDSSQDEQVTSLAWLWGLLRIGGSVLAVILVLLAPTIVLGWSRARLRRARVDGETPVARMSGGWAEIVDQASDVGARLDHAGTRREHAQLLEAAYPAAGASALAVRADAAVFGADDIPDAEVEAYWTDVATARSRIVRAVPWRRRVVARLWPASGARALRDAIRRAGSGLPWARGRRDERPQSGGESS